jgi:hypothetical protein
MSDYEPPKWLKKQFVELVHKIPTEDIHEIIIEAANDAANLAFDHVYETLVTLASEKPSLPVKEAIIDLSGSIPEFLLELKNIFQNSSFTSQQFINYLEENPQQKDWFKQQTGGACRAANVFGGFLGKILKSQKDEAIQIEKVGYMSPNKTSASLWRIKNVA